MVDVPINEKIMSQLLVNKIKGDSSEFKVKIVGNSMYPTLKDGEIVSIKPLKSKYDVGDIVCFFRDKLYLVVHRIVKVIKSSNKIIYITQGDNMEHPDARAVREDDIVGHYEEKILTTFIKTYYFDRTVNVMIISNIMEVIHFVGSIFPQGVIENVRTHKDSKTLFCINVYRDREQIIIEVYSNYEREVFKFDNMANVCGHIYSILFNSDALVKRDCICLHAGVVKNQYHNIIVIGGSGQGKSTLLYELTQRGYMYAGDEKLFICVDKEKIVFQPYYTPIMLRGDYAREIPIHDYVVVNKEKEYEKKYPYVPKHIFDNIDDQSKKILIIPNWIEENGFAVKKLRKTEVIQLLIENVVNLKEIARDIKQLVSLASLIEGYNIVYSKIEDVVAFFNNLNDSI